MASTPVAGRDRYFDTLRAIAIVRVVVFHAFPVAALELVFPSMGVMFALGGSLMVKSIDRSAAKAVQSRIRRLLPALWVMGLMLVPVMLVHGWPDRPSWPRLLLWAFPIADPPSSEFGEPAAGVLWYLVTYLWLVLLSPLLVKLYRRWALATILLPLAGLALMVTYPTSLGETAGWVVTNVLTFGSCWILGFAHRDGALRKLSPALVATLAVACVGVGLGWALTHRVEDGTPGGAIDLVGVPLAYAVFSMGFVLALLRWEPRMAWPAKMPPLNGFVSLVNNRAVTIYLWHNLAITIAIALDDPLKLWRLHPVFVEQFADFTLAMVLLLIVVFALGWVEDVAAKRKARLSPFPARTVPRPFEASTETIDPTPRQPAGV
jgi:peptidoglycan/LPS O-acetylase OafA/YrhL